MSVKAAKRRASGRSEAEIQIKKSPDMADRFRAGFVNLLNGLEWQHDACDLMCLAWPDQLGFPWLLEQHPAIAFRKRLSTVYEGFDLLFLGV